MKIKKPARISEIHFERIEVGMRLLLCELTKKYPRVVDVVTIDTIYKEYYGMHVKYSLSTCLTTYRDYRGIKAKNNLGEEIELVLYNDHKGFSVVRKSPLPLIGEHVDVIGQYYTFFTF